MSIAIIFWMALGWGLVLIWAPRESKRAGAARRFAAGDGIAIAVSAVLSAAVFTYLQWHVRAPWLIHLPWQVIVTGLVFLTSAGLIAACLGRGLGILVYTAGTIILAIVCILIFLPFGFDHQSTAGLDFGHLIVLMACGAATAIGGVIAFVLKK
jgi:hypothetical protein